MRNEAGYKKAIGGNICLENRKVKYLGRELESFKELFSVLKM